MPLNRLFHLRSLKSRLAAWVILPSLLLIATDLFVSYRNSEQVATLIQQQLLHGAAAAISEQIAVSDDEYEISVPPAAFDLLKNRFKDRVFYAIHGADRQLLAGDDQLPPYEGDFGPDGEAFFLATVRGEAVRVIAYSYAVPNSPQDDTVITQVAQTLRNHDEFRDDLLQSTLRRHALLMAAMILFLAVALRWMLQPLVAFGGTLMARQPGSLEKLDEKEAPSELEPVIHAMNDYVRRLDYTLTSHEKFVANTAHHLRNAFAILATQVNFAKRSSTSDPVQQEVLRAVQKTLGKCTRVINQLLMLASLDQPKKPAMRADKVALATVVKNVVEEFAPLAQQRGIELGVELPDEDVVVSAQPRLMQELLANLVGNAIQHMGKQGQVTVTIASDEGETRLVVADDGVGIPEALREKVFERFFRIDESNPDGSGLGLAIVKEICDTLGARISLSAPDTGSGLTVTVRFPPQVSPSPAAVEIGADAIGLRE